MDAKADPAGEGASRGPALDCELDPGLYYGRINLPTLLPLPCSG
jgi:hypothetical protein